MTEQEKRVAISVLVTREEYMAFTVQLMKKLRGNRPKLTEACGAVLIAAGIAGLFFGDAISLLPSAAICLLLIGLFLACYNGLLAPVLDRAAAAREYDEKEDVRQANSYVFSDTAVEIRNGRMEGELPLQLATRYIETADLFSVSFGRECHVVIPKRLLTSTQKEELKEIFLHQTEAQAK